MTGAPLTMFDAGDLVRVRHRDRWLPGVWVFGRICDGGRAIEVRREGRASPRYLEAAVTELVDHDARRDRP